MGFLRVAALVALAIPGLASADDYTAYQFKYRFDRIDPTAANVGTAVTADSLDGSEQFPGRKIDFTFSWQGNNRTTAYLSQYGAIDFYPDDTACGRGNNGCMFNTPGAVPQGIGFGTPKEFIAPWWANLHLDPGGLGGPSALINQTSIGKSPDRVGIYEWDNMIAYGVDPKNDPAALSKDSTYSFQVRLYETANVAIVSYGPKTNGTDKSVKATAGAEGHAGNAGGYLLSCQNNCGDSDFVPDTGVIIPVPSTAELIPYTSIDTIAVGANTITFNVDPRLTNAGKTDATGVGYDLYLSKQNSTDPDLLNRITGKTNLNISAESYYDAGSSAVALAKPADGVYYVVQVANPNGATQALTINDTDRASAPIVVGADLLGSISGPTKAGTDTPITLNITLQNRGSKDSGQFQYRICASSDKLPRIGALDVCFKPAYTDSVAAYSTKSFQKTVNLDRNTPASNNTYYKLSINDGAVPVSEATTSNNVAVGNSFQVSPPNLVVQSYQLLDSTGELYIGRPVHVQASVTNSGGGVAHYFTYSLKMTREDPGGNPGIITFNSPDVAQLAQACPTGQNSDCTGIYAGAICGPNQANPDFDPQFAPGDCEVACQKDADCPAGTGLKCDVDFAGGWCTNYLQPGETKVIDLIGNLPDRDPRDPRGPFPTDKPFPCWLGVFADSWNTITNEAENDNIVQNKADKPYSCRAPAPDAQVVNDTFAVPPITDFVAPRNTAGGEGMQVFRDIHNIGNVDADIPYSYYLSANSTVSINDMVIPFDDGKTIHTVHLVAGTDSQAYDTLVVPPNINPNTSFYIGIVLDPKNTVAELKENNNVAVSAKQLTVSSGPLTVDQSPPPTAIVGVPYVHQLVAFGGDGEYSWSVIPGLSNRCNIEPTAVGCELPEGLTLLPSGILSGTPTANALKINDGLYDFGVQVTSGTSTFPAIYTMRVVQPTGPLTILTGLFDGDKPISHPILPTAYVNTHYKAALVASGGVPPYTWEVQTSGGGIDPDPEPNQNILEGTPNLVGNITVTAKVTDSRKAAVTQQFKIPVVRGADPAVQILTTTLQPAVTGEEYQQGYLDAQNGDAQSYHWTATPLPPGMVLDADTMRAKIHGVPTEIGSWVIQVSVVDGDGNRAQSVVGLQVNGSNYLKSKQLKGGQPGQVYSDAVHVQGGANPVSYQIVAGNLPDGLTLAEDGKITGTVSKDATPRAYNFAIEARDLVHHVGRAAFAIYVDNPPAPQVSTEPPPKGGCSTSGSLPTWAGVVTALGLAALRKRRS